MQIVCGKHSVMDFWILHSNGLLLLFLSCGQRGVSELGSFSSLETELFFHITCNKKISHSYYKNKEIKTLCDCYKDFIKIRELIKVIFKYCS